MPAGSHDLAVLSTSEIRRAFPALDRRQGGWPVAYLDGPHVGILYGKRGRLDALDVPKHEPAPADPPDRFETGTQNHEGIAGVASAVDFLAGLANVDPRPDAGPAPPNRRRRLEATYRELHRRGGALLGKLWDGLGKIEGITLHGPDPSVPRTPTLSLTIAGRSSSEACGRLAERGIFASQGNFYALTVARRLGVGEEGFIRLGCACYTDDEEVDRILEAVREIAGR